MTPLHGDRLLRRSDRGRNVAPVAVIGAGPSGLACAHDLAVMGYRVTVFEAMPRSGGMMRYGIPAYRLAREVIDRQTEEIERLGVEFRFNTQLSANFGVHDLLGQGFGAVFLAVGASRGRSVPIENSEAEGVVKAIDYLLNINRGYRVPVGNKVVVIGGGLVAIDAARIAVRELISGLPISVVDEQAVEAGTFRVALDVAREAVRRGAMEVTVVSLESENEMPALKSEQGREEAEAASEEGIRFLPSWGPRRIVTRDGKAAGIELVRCLRVFDEGGRFKPEFDDSDRRILDADTVILAIGQAPDLSFLGRDEIAITAAGTLKIDPVTLATSIPGVFAGGDAAFPPSLLITVAQHGKLAAQSIDCYLHGEKLPVRELQVRIEELPTDSYTMPDQYELRARSVPLVPLKRRSGITEVESAFSPEQAHAQAGRCLYCHVHPIYDSAKCILCNRCVDICPEHCLRFVAADRVRDQAPLEAFAHQGGAASAFLYDEEKCIRCGLCAIRCPTAAITMERFQFEEVGVR